jgi:hypothetical protein
MSDLSQPDPCDELLVPKPAEESDALRSLVLARTTRVLRGRRWTRRAGMALVVVAFYAAGLVTMHWLTPAAPAITVYVEKTPEGPPAPQAKEPVPSPSDMEWQLLDHPNQPRQVALYREAGDRYLAEASDPESALRCYRRMLDVGSDADLAISPDDNWLLLAAKAERQKEKRDAKAN